MSRFLGNILVLGGVFAVAVSAPASAATMIATWTGTILSGSVTSANGGSVDGLATGDYSGQAFTAVFQYDTAVLPGQTYYSNPTASYLFGGAGFGANPLEDAFITVGGVTIDLLAPTGLVQQQAITGGLIEQQSDNSWTRSSMVSGALQTETYDKGLTLGGYGTFPDALDQDFSANFDSTSFGQATDCDVIDRYTGRGGVSETSPYCLSFSLAPTSVNVVDPPSGVPEPADWALMLVGFGVAGAMLRRRRSLGALLA
jgi:hypothetical protein